VAHGVEQLRVAGDEAEGLLHEEVALPLRAAHNHDARVRHGDGLPHREGGLRDILPALAAGETHGPLRREARVGHRDLVVHELEGQHAPREEVEAEDAGPGLPGVVRRRTRTEDPGRRPETEGLEVRGIRAAAGEGEQLVVGEGGARRRGPDILAEQDPQAGRDVVGRLPPSWAWDRRRAPHPEARQVHPDRGGSPPELASDEGGGPPGRVPVAGQSVLLRRPRRRWIVRRRIDIRSQGPTCIGIPVPPATRPTWRQYRQTRSSGRRPALQSLEPNPL